MLKGFVSGEEKDIVRIPMKGKNLFSTTWEQGSINGTTGANEGSGTIVRTAGYIPIKTNQTYSIKRDISNGYINVRLYDTNKGYIGSGSDSTIRLISGTTPGNPMGNNLSFCCFNIIADGAAFIRFNDSSNNTDTHFMMVEGEYTQQTMPDYEPYGYQEGWEVRDNQDRLIWGREDELQTTTGTLPFKGYALPVKVKSLLGNAVQNGTPSPQNIVVPEMCGVRTGNLCDMTTVENGKNVSADGSITNYLKRCSTVTPIDVSAYSNVTLVFTSTLSRTRIIYALFNDSTLVTRQTAIYSGSTIDVSSGNKLYICFYDPADTETVQKSDLSNVMLNSGSAPLPYEPYGYKIPLTNAGQTIPVYLGEVPTVRRVRKLVLTGEETVESGSTTVYIQRPDMLAYSPAVCSHYQYFDGLISGAPDMSIATGSGAGTSFWFKDSGYGNDAAGFKSYLASQYQAGHPVTVWYVLANEQTTISNEPLCKISTYADELNSTVATLPEIPTTTGQNTLTVDTNLAPSSLTVEVHAKKIHYGFKIDKSNDDSDSAVIYTHDAVTMTPAHMDFTNDRFDYGSWGNAFFVRDCYPVALNLDGTIAYRLDPDDYTKKTDGTPSDIFYELLTAAPSDWSTQWKQYYTKSGDEYVLNDQSTVPTFATDTYYKLTYNSSFAGNFMMAFPKVWFYRHEDSQYNYIEISNYKLSDDWKCYAHINASGQEVDFIYLPLFKGVIKDSKLRSLPGQIPQGGTNATTEVNAATALGSRWQIWDHSSVECLNDLLTLMSKSIDSQGRFGKGRESGYNSTDTVTYGKLQTGTLIKKGKFHGYSATTKEVKVFGFEGFWANRYDRIQGLLLVSNVWTVKMTPPYNFTGTDFITLSNTDVPTGNGYLSRIQTSEYGSLPAAIISSDSKYFKDYFNRNTSGIRVALHGGACSDGGSCGFRNVRVYTGAVQSAGWSGGASPVYK